MISINQNQALALYNVTERDGRPVSTGRLRLHDYILFCNEGVVGTDGRALICYPNLDTPTDSDGRWLMFREDLQLLINTPSHSTIEVDLISGTATIVSADPRGHVCQITLLPDGYRRTPFDPPFFYPRYDGVIAHRSPIVAETGFTSEVLEKLAAFAKSSKSDFVRLQLTGDPKDRLVVKDGDENIAVFMPFENKSIPNRSVYQRMGPDEQALSEQALSEQGVVERVFRDFETGDLVVVVAMKEEVTDLVRGDHISLRSPS